MNSRVSDLCYNTHLPLKWINTTSRALRAAFAMIGLLVVAQPASAATILVNGSGQLTGATGVNVAGTFYDVSFTNESCVTRYEGCDEVSDFLFTNLSAASAASQALLDQVFVDGTSGLFDTVPGLTFGCLAATPECYALTPYGFTLSGQGTTHMLAAGAVNRILVDQTNNNSLSPTTNFVSVNQGFAGRFSFILADWAPAANVPKPPATAPEPASMLLLGTGLAAAGVRRRRQKRAILRASVNVARNLDCKS
jgi:hypothetical protein